VRRSQEQGIQQGQLTGEDHRNLQYSWVRSGEKIRRCTYSRVRSGKKYLQYSGVKSQENMYLQYSSIRLG